MKIARILKTALPALLLLASVSGCASLFECYDTGAMKIRNKALAHHAWERWQWCYADMPCRADFARGFKDGYTDVVKGGTGCQPVLPPRFYWSVHYQNADGHCHINSWFDGYTHGAMAAAQDGYASSGRIPISPSARGNWMRQQTILEEQNRARNQAYLKRDNLDPIEAPFFGTNPTPSPGGAPTLGTGGGAGSDSDAGVPEPPTDLDPPPRPYEEDARYRAPFNQGPAGEQFLNPLPASTPPYSQPAQAGLPVQYN